jgi:hypothetical protein
VNSAAMNTCVQGATYPVLCSFGQMPRSGIMDHMAVVYLVFRGISILLSMVVVLFAFPPAVYRVSVLPHPHQHLLLLLTLIMAILTGVR